MAVKHCFLWKKQVIPTYEKVEGKKPYIYMLLKKIRKNTRGKNKMSFSRRQMGFSIPEMVIVLLIITIIMVLALPQIMSSRRLFNFAGMQRQMLSVLRSARQEAMTQRKPITFQYDDVNKRIVVYGGKYGSLGNSGNQVFQLGSNGLSSGNIIYGRPSGVTASPLGDGTDLTSLTSGVVKIKFLGDGSVVDASGNFQDNALFFYHKIHQKGGAFAISILGANGRVKVWRYIEGEGTYVE